MAEDAAKYNKLDTEYKLLRRETSKTEVRSAHSLLQGTLLGRLFVFTGAVQGAAAGPSAAAGVDGDGRGRPGRGGG